MESIRFHQSGLEVAQEGPEPSYYPFGTPTAPVQIPKHDTNGQDEKEFYAQKHTSRAKFEQSPCNKFSSMRSRCLDPWFIAAIVVTAVIVGSAVGGGVGASLSSCRTELSSSHGSLINTSSPVSERPATTTPDAVSTTSSSAPFATTTGGLLLDYYAESPSKVYSLNDSCSELTSSTQTTTYGDDFTVYCNVDFGTGIRRAADGSNITLVDIACIIAYSMGGCIQACSDYTARSKKFGVNNMCGSVTYKWAMSQAPVSNCCLKNSTVTHEPGYVNDNITFSATILG
ncbi:hypothetical protein F5Y16DRAFT_396650 [Xylariaceae sp. FL0255]|nr:hypothetical protein F5Y16DRAFT_396650 [Xylariaceae sp. FL0255]